jgi:hypothetical protein
MTIVNERKTHYSEYYLDAIMLDVLDRHIEREIYHVSPAIIHSVIDMVKYPEDAKYISIQLTREFKEHV